MLSSINSTMAALSFKGISAARETSSMIEALWHKGACSAAEVFGAGSQEGLAVSGLGFGRFWGVAVISRSSATASMVVATADS
jgi:hypothetical protein